MGDLLYLYGLIPTKETTEQSFPSFKGFDNERELYPIPVGDTTAIVCNLDSGEYSEDSIKEKINNDMQWLQEKAFHHHETVLTLSKAFTVIPLKFCTLYKNKDSLTQTVQSNQAKMESTFELLEGNEEWNLKIYCDDKILKEQVSENNPAIEAKRIEINELPKGRQFFEKKKLDKLIESELEEEKNRVSEEIHFQLKEFVLQGNVKRNWSKDVTGKDENMTWNSVYLIPKSDVEPFLEKIQQYEKEMKEMGWQFAPSGPWPAYHFSSFS
ncbi:GvpL/GvpF family gas vesicle protein [Jeotgalibacillus proteolyticus]|uniref:Gas vesicle protein GvpL n=1 Tax=Jeotgalibacillus proteolyticus TaxID=2082395 RepID=A0A2S5GCX3_9BACL|nr:GvpL/GvpF family gas vesicle protein [Jeotgalibacillus proteolyticus]PPA70839.1 gas vesicle protein GvpL [Jeotgalibacillus proteolyticus]